MQATFTPREIGNLQGVITYVFGGDGVDLCPMWSSRAMQLSPFILTLATFLTPCQHQKGSGFKKGVCCGGFMPWEPPSGGSLVC